MTKSNRAARQRSKSHGHAKGFAYQPGLRALTRLKALPDNDCACFLIGDDASIPHLLPGEYAVIDCEDRALANGELYLWQVPSGPRRRYIKHVASDILNITGPGAEPSYALRDLGALLPAEAGWERHEQRASS